MVKWLESGDVTHLKDCASSSYRKMYNNIGSEYFTEQRIVFRKKQTESDFPKKSRISEVRKTVTDNWRAHSSYI